MGKGTSKIHVRRRRISTDRHREVRVEVEVRATVVVGEGKAKGWARRVGWQGEIDHRELAL